MFTKQLLHGFLSRVHDVCFTVTYWDGDRVSYGSGEPRFGIIVRDPSVVEALCADVETGFATAYVDGRIEVESDVADVVAAAIRNTSLEKGWTAKKLTGIVRVAANHAPRRRSLRQQKEDIAQHYDLGNDFFRLFLDPSMTYSCAYFRTPDDSLEQAQEQKIEHSLRKLCPKAGETLLDIGCGWGSIVLRAAEAHGMRALGITLSEEQARAARATIGARNLEDSCDVRLVNYAEQARQGHRFDKIISIGMMEHVGHAHLAEFTRAVKEMLVPGGLALLHCITRTWHAPDEGFEGGFIQRIFPGGYIPALPELLEHFGSCGLHLLDAENLRPHYQLTLDRWSERYERHVETVRERFGEEFVRLWRLYLRGCSAGFREGTIHVHQFLLSNGLPSAYPLARETVSV